MDNIYKSLLSNTSVEQNFQGIFGEVGRGIQSLDDLNFYGTVFLEEAKGAKGILQYHGCDSLSPGRWKGYFTKENDIFLLMERIQ